MIEYLADYGFTLCFLVIYIAFCLSIGWYFQKKASTGVEAYFLAKRQMPGWVISLAFFSTFASTNTYIGQAGMSFQYGLSWAWVGFFWTVFCIISWLILGPRMRNQTARLGCYTIPDYFEYRYQSRLSKLIRILSAVTILFATVWYMTGIAKGCAHIFESVLKIPYFWGAAIIIFVTTAYSIWGGMFSILWTDAIQGIMMFAVAIIMLTLPFIYAGGVEQLFIKITNLSHPTENGQPLGNGLMQFGSLVSFFYILGIGLAVGMKQISEPRCLIRFYSINNARGMKFAMIWTPFFLGISLVSVMGLGALVHGMATDDEAAYLIKNTDEVIGFMLDKFDNKIVSSLCVSGLFAAGMSSLASVILIVGTAFVKDIWHVYRPLTEGKMIRNTKLVMLSYSLIVFIFTLYPPAGIVELTAFSGAVFAASFFPAIFGGLYLRWGTDAGAMASMIMGILVNMIWRFTIRFKVAGMEEIHEVIPAFIISILVYLVVSYFTSHRVPDERHLSKVFVGS